MTNAQITGVWCILLLPCQRTKTHDLFRISFIHPSGKSLRSSGKFLKTLIFTTRSIYPSRDSNNKIATQIKWIYDNLWKAVTYICHWRRQYTSCHRNTTLPKMIASIEALLQYLKLPKTRIAVRTSNIPTTSKTDNFGSIETIKRKSRLLKINSLFCYLSVWQIA
jgi:hypothetical protein